MLRLFDYIKDNRAKSISVYKLLITLAIGIICALQFYLAPAVNNNLLILVFGTSLFTTIIWHVVFSGERYSKTVSMYFFGIDSILIVAALFPLAYLNPGFPLLFFANIVGIRFLLGGKLGENTSIFSIALFAAALGVYFFTHIIDNPVYHLSLNLIPALLINGLCSFTLTVISNFQKKQRQLEQEKNTLDRNYNNLKKELFLNSQIVTSLNKDVKRKNVEIRNILSMSGQLNINSDSRKAIESYLYAAIGQLGCKYAMILTQTKRENNFYSALSVKGLSGPEINNMRIYLNSNLLNTLQSAKEPMLERNIPKSDLYDDEVKMLKMFTDDLFCPILIKGNIAGVLIVGQKISKMKFTKEDLNLITIVANQASYVMEQTQTTSDFQDTYFKTIKAMMKSLEAKYIFARGHNTRTANYVNIIASKMGFPSNEVKDLTYGTLLHDIGKIAIRDKYLLDPHVYENNQSLLKNKILEHTIKGATILKSSGFEGNVVDLALHHHEDYNGMGYPHGLGEHDISLGVRVLSVCNTYDAMTSDRPHRKALEEITAKEFLEYNSGKKFDPQVVKTFLNELAQNKEMQKFH
jgi:putative nucleotidyltransferase with HDIG domain